MSTVRQKPYLVHAVEHALDLLEAFSQGEGERSLTDLSEATGLGPSTVHRLLSTLQARGFVRQNPDNRRYRLGVRAIVVGTSALNQLGIQGAARPHLERLTLQTGETVNLSVLEDGEHIYLDQLVNPSAPIQLFSRIGGRGPIHCTASGKALLAFLPTSAVEALVTQGLPAHTARTRTDLPGLLEALAEVRERGYALCLAEWREEVSSLAAPIRDFSGRVVAAGGIVGLTSSFSAERIPALALQVVAAARAISTELGYQSSDRAGPDQDAWRAPGQPPQFGVA